MQQSLQGVTHQWPVSPSQRPFTLSPVTHPSAMILAATSESMASKAAKALLCTWSTNKGWPEARELHMFSRSIYTKFAS